MNLSELSSADLDLQNIGNWPPMAKGLAIGFVCLVLLGLGYWFDSRAQFERLDQAKAQEEQLKKTFEIKAEKAANLDSYKQQMKEIEQSFGTMLRQLPGKTEVADLLLDINQTGLVSGLQFELFKPREEVSKEFYVELPIDMRVRGRYHEFGKFVSGVAALPRIVTLHDFTIEPADDNSGELVMELTAKTYRYLDQGGEGQGANVAKAGGG